MVVYDRPIDRFDPATSFGEDVAAIYDRHSPRGDEAATVAFLEQLAGDGPALELAIGTGRIACRWPLAVCASTASTSRRRWLPGSVTSRVAMASW